MNFIFYRSSARNDNFGELEEEVESLRVIIYDEFSVVANDGQGKFRW